MISLREKWRNMIMNNIADEQKLVDDAETLKNTMAKLSKLLVKAANVVRRIETETDPDVAETF